MKKEQVIKKLKKGSGIITVLCLAAVVFDLCLLIAHGKNIAAYGSGWEQPMLYSKYRECITFGINSVIMLIAAVLFFRIAKNGMPFTAGNIRLVRIIGVLFLLNAAIPSVAAAGISNGDFGYASIINPLALVEGLLFLFISYIIRYGAMLQQESDETL